MVFTSLLKSYATSDSRPSIMKISFFMILTGLAAVSLYVSIPTGSNYGTRQNTPYILELKDMEDASYSPRRFHQDGFGGIYNIGHAPGARAFRHLATNVPVIIPTSAVPHAVESLSEENIRNLRGHYLHDEHRSPFASYLYDRPAEELKKEQEEFEKKLDQIRKEYGAWDFHDHAGKSIRPIPNFEKVPYRDMKNKDFPATSWQMDQKYVTDLISEGKKLIVRMRKGLYAEYGWDDSKDTQERDDAWNIEISEEKTRGQPGIGWISTRAFNMLAKKLLHAMITNDEFYFILGGHSAAAGHGNNHSQQYTMQFAEVMEPVFQKLGVRLIARNMAMGGLGTIHFGVGSGHTYGEKDYIRWDSGMTEGRIMHNMDIFNKQAILGGERVPIISTDNPLNLEKESNGTFWWGKMNNLPTFVPLTTGLDQVETVPLAAQYLKCADDVKELCADKGNPNKYHSVCWEPRSDYTPAMTQVNAAGGTASWHPGDRYHRMISRQDVFLFLKAFDKAFELWEEGIEKDGFPLKETYWHVGGDYMNVQSKLSEFLNGEGLGESACEKGLQGQGLDKACRIRMKAMTEWTPGNPTQQIRRYAKSAKNGYKMEWPISEVYQGIDVLPLSWKVPLDQVDLHAIAIVTTSKAPEYDFEWTEGPSKDEESIPTNSRRYLRDTIQTITVQSTKESNEAIFGIEEDRALITDVVVPGVGWGILSPGAVGFCDGSAQSLCYRSSTMNCLLQGTNDAHNNVVGNALSGWLVLTLPKVSEGFVFMKLEWWYPRGNDFWLTKDWTELNNGIDVGERNLKDEVEGERSMKALPKPWPADMEIDIAVNGKIVDTLHGGPSVNSVPELIQDRPQLSYNEQFFKLLDDKSLADGGDLEFAIRIRSTENPKDASFGISYIYYA